MDYTTKCNGCGEEFYERELKDKLCCDCEYLSNKGGSMKINFNQPIKNIQKEEIKDLTLKSVSVEALLATFSDEQSLSGEEKAKRYLLATRIYANSEELDLTVEEIAKIKQLIGKGYGPLIVGQAWDMLEGNKA